MSIIRSVEAFPLRLPRVGTAAQPRYNSAPHVRSVYPSRDETVLVRIATDDHVGWGEALAPVNPEAPATIIRDLFASMLVGSDFDGPRPVMARLQDSMRERGHMSGHHADAAAGVDIALWDLFGKEAGLPVHKLLGGARRSRVPVYLTSVGGDTPEAKASAAVAGYRAGFSSMKLHLAMGVDGALTTVDAVLAALAEEATPHQALRVAVDTHWVHDLGSARRLGRALDERRIWFFEAPLAPEDLRGHEMLAADLATPVAVGEAMRHRFEFAQWGGARALGIGQPDIGRTGISEGSTIAAILAAHHIPVAPHHSMATALAYAAGLHVTAAAESTVGLEFGPGVLAKSAALMHSEAMAEGAVADGTVTIGIAPGLGVDVDEAAVRELASEL